MGTTTLRVLPTFTPMARAISFPMIMFSGGGGESGSEAGAGLSRQLGSPSTMWEKKSEIWRSRSGSIPFRTAPWLRCVLEMKTWLKMAGALPVMRGTRAIRLRTASKSRTGVLSRRSRLTCEVAPTIFSWMSSRNPVDRASATTSAMTPAVIPSTEMAEMTETIVCLRFAFR